MKKLTVTFLFLSSVYTGLSIAQSCNGAITAEAPDSRYTLSASGTALDKKTGLTWMRCNLGQVWDGVTCTGTAQPYTWQTALQIAQSTVFAEQSDWRLPNQKELQSLVENRCYAPAINLTAFPNGASGWAWSSSPSASSSSYAWVVGFGNGYDSYGNKGSSNAVRLVRGGQ